MKRRQLLGENELVQRYYIYLPGKMIDQVEAEGGARFVRNLLQAFFLHQAEDPVGAENIFDLPTAETPARPRSSTPPVIVTPREQSQPQRSPVCQMPEDDWGGPLEDEEDIDPELLDLPTAAAPSSEPIIYRAPTPRRASEETIKKEWEATSMLSLEQQIPEEQKTWDDWRREKRLEAERWESQASARDPWVLPSVPDNLASQQPPPNW